MSIKSIWDQLFGSKRVQPTSTVVEPADCWLQFANELYAKLDFARSIDISKVVEQANSTPETVERLAGHPSLWLQFGTLVQATEKQSLKDMLTLGKNILAVAGRESELWSWYQAYMNSSSGRGDIDPVEYLYFWAEDLAVLDQTINLGKHIQERLSTFTNFNEFKEAARCVPESYWRGDSSGGHNFIKYDHYEVFSNRKDTLLNAAHAACNGQEDLLKFYRSISMCSENHRNPFCCWNKYYTVGHEIFEIVEKQLKSAKTAAELEAIEVPMHLGQRSELTVSLESEKQELLKALRVREEEIRVCSALRR